MTIRQLLYLKTIAEKKSYTMASQALFVTIELDMEQQTGSK